MGDHWNLYFISLFFYTFSFSVSLGRIGSIKFLERLTKIWISNIECVSVFHWEKDLQSLQKSNLLSLVRGDII